MRPRPFAPELNELVGERLPILYTPHDLRSIELFPRQRLAAATVYPQHTLSAEPLSAYSSASRCFERRSEDAA